MNDARHDPAVAAERTRYDLRTATQARADWIAPAADNPEPDCTVWTQRTNTRLGNHDELLTQQAAQPACALDALDYLTRRVGALGADISALRGTVSSHDETLQVITLRGDDGR